MMRSIFTFLCGLVFALGLGISQMTRPPKILGFLNVLGDWDPTLLVVFATATCTYLIFHRFVFGKSITKAFEENLRPKEKLEPRVMIGAMIFGIGWGLIGLCPGPAVTDLASGQLPIFLFVGGMLLGMFAMKGK